LGYDSGQTTIVSPIVEDEEGAPLAYTAMVEANIDTPSCQSNHDKELFNLCLRTRACRD